MGISEMDKFYEFVNKEVMILDEKKMYRTPCINQFDESIDRKCKPMKLINSMNPSSEPVEIFKVNQFNESANKGTAGDKSMGSIQ